MLARGTLPGAGTGSGSLCTPTILGDRKRGGGAATMVMRAVVMLAVVQRVASSPQPPAEESGVAFGDEPDPMAETARKADRGGAPAQVALGEFKFERTDAALSSKGGDAERSLSATSTQVQISPCKTCIYVRGPRLPPLSPVSDVLDRPSRFLAVSAR